MTDRTDSQTGLIQTEVRGADTVVATVTVQAPRPLVFKAFTDPAVLVQWFWPQRFGTRFDRDLRPGGAFGIHADGLPDGQDVGVTGVYQEVDDPARLTMSWQWTGETAVSQVAIELRDDMNVGVAENLTEVVVTHSANPTPTDTDDHLQGWRDCLGRLAETFSTTASGASTGG